MKRRKASIVAPFVGNGKLSEYKDKKDSWIYNQMQKGEYQPGINIVNEQFIRFSFVKNRIASEILSEKFDYKKTYKVLSEKQIQLSWFIKSKIDNSTVSELNEVSQMIKDFSDTDLIGLKKQIIDNGLDLTIAQNDTNMQVKIDNEIEKIYLNRNILVIGNQMEVFEQILKSNFFEEN